MAETFSFRHFDTGRQKLVPRLRQKKASWVTMLKIWFYKNVKVSL